MLLAALGWLAALPACAGPATEPPAADCQALARRFDATLAAAPGTCISAADCACYPDLRIDGRLGVSDETSARRLTALSEQYRQQRCPTVFMSPAGPPVCAPVCRRGRCALP